jgi:hypothetical protein
MRRTPRRGQDWPVSKNNRTTSAMATTATTTANPTSSPLTPDPADAARDIGAGRGAAAELVAADRCAAPGAGVGAGTDPAGEPEANATPATGAPGAGAAPATAAGAGILMVGAAVGLGGRLIRTVSFFGCTFAASAGLGGAAPVGGLGVSSAITDFLFRVQPRSGFDRCQMVIRMRRDPHAVVVGLQANTIR